MADTVKKLSVKFEGDTKGLTTAIKQATASFNDISSAVKTFDKSLESFGTDIPFDKQAEAAELLGARIEAAEKALKQLNEWMEQLEKEDPANKLTSSFQKLSSKVKELEGEIVKDKKRLSELNDGAVTFANTIKNVKKSLSDTSKSASVFKEALDLDPTNVEKQKTYVEALKQSIATCKEQQTLLNEQIENMQLSNADVLSGKYVELTSALNTSISSQKEYEEELQRIYSVTTKASESTDSFVDSFLKIENLQYISQWLDKVSNSLISITKSTFENATSYESNIASIRKVVKDLSEETVEELKQIAVETGSTFESISQYATIGATLGIAQDALSEFTQAMVDLEVASDSSIAGEEGAASVARLLNQFDIGAQYAENFGSAVTYVGDQFAATASEILETSSRMGGLSAINNVTINDLIGLSSEMKNLGIETEAGASAITKAFLTINTSVETGNKKLATFADTANMSSEEFTKAWKSAPMEAFLSFINGLSTEVFDEINTSVEQNTDSLEEYASALNVTTESFKKLWEQDPTGTFEKYKEALGDLEEGSESASVVLTDLSLSGVRVAQTLLKLAGNGDVVRQAIEDSSQAWEDNTNLTRKANEVYETTEYKLKSAQEAISQAAAALGDTFLPIVKDVADIVTSLAKSFNNLPSSTKKSSAAILVVTAALTKLSSMGLSTYIMLDRVAKASLGAEGSVKTLAVALSGKLATAMSALPIALAVAGAGILAYKAYTVYASNETVKFTKEMRELADEANQSYSLALENLTDELVNIKNAFDNVDEASKNLEFNENGKLDTTKDSYSTLSSAVDELNGILGETKYHIDEETGSIKDQTDKVIELTEAYKNERIEKQRNAWLDSHQDEYDTAFNKAQETFENTTNYLADLKNRINEIREEYYDSNWFNGFSDTDWQNWASVMQGLTDMSELTDYDKSQVEKLVQELSNVPDQEVLELTESIYDLGENAKTAFTTIDNYNKVASASLEEVQNIIRQLSFDSGAVDFSWDSSKIDDCASKLNTANDNVKLLQALLEANPQYVEMIQPLIDKWKETGDEIYNDISKLQEQQQAISDTTDVNLESIEEIKSGWETTTEAINNSLDSIQTKAESVFNSAKEYYLSTKSELEKGIDVAIRYNYQESGSSNFGARLNQRAYNTDKSGGFNSGFTSLMPNLTIPKLSSGGHSGITLKANFNINNNGANITQQVTEKIGRSLVNYINEELGRNL